SNETGPVPRPDRLVLRIGRGQRHRGGVGGRPGEHLLKTLHPCCRDEQVCPFFSQTIRPGQIPVPSHLGEIVRSQWSCLLPRFVDVVPQIRHRPVRYCRDSAGGTRGSSTIDDAPPVACSGDDATLLLYLIL